jgi:RNA recognition motif-containing protein
MNIYITQLDTQWKDMDLKNLFAPYGEVASAEISIDSFTDKSRGFGYVEMPNDEEAQKAIKALNETEVNGQKISVQQAEPKDVRKGSYKVGNGAVNMYRFRKN